MSNKKNYRKQELGLKGYRHNMVVYARKYGISAAATEYKTTRKTVRKWLKQFEAHGHAGLENKSRLGQYHPNALSADVIEQINTKRGDGRMGAYYIKESLGLKCSTKTIHKYLKRAGKVTKHKTKTQKKRDMSFLRDTIKVVEKLQIDVKYLTDIPNLLWGIKFFNFPKYQITARDYASGNAIIGYSYTKDSTSVGIFVAYVIYLLLSAGIDVKEIHFQFDNGSEFRNLSKNKGLSFVEEICTVNGVEYRYNPVARPTYNSHVESFHGTIERELYDYMKYESLDDFLAQAWIYMTWYNTKRKNRNKDHKTPEMILTENKIKKNNYLTTSHPILVDNYMKDLEMVKKGGYLK